MLTTISHSDRVRDGIAPLRQQLENHPLYREITTVQDLRLFMQSHVFAVWDFMSVLKALQQSLTSVAVPWVPSLYPNACRLINEIVLGEESDTYAGGHLSHFELYLEAMRDGGADTVPITRVTEQVRSSQPWMQALAAAEVPAEAQAFVKSTFHSIQIGKPHVAAAAFTFGREDLIPSMFREIVHDLRKNFAGLAVFEYYLERHIEVDGDTHGPMALKMLEDLCGDDETRWAEAMTAAKSALEARLQLWDGILNRIVQARQMIGPAACVSAE